MIKEFLALQNSINARGVLIGRALQASHHYICTDAPFPAASPFVYSIHDLCIAVAVGVNNDRSTAVVQVPIQLFEFGTPDNIAVWVAQQNNFKNAATLPLVENAQLMEDMHVMEALKKKYPDEFR